MGDYFESLYRLSTLAVSSKNKPRNWISLQLLLSHNQMAVVIVTINNSDIITIIIILINIFIYQLLLSHNEMVVIIVIAINNISITTVNQYLLIIEIPVIIINIILGNLSFTF